MCNEQHLKFGHTFFSYIMLFKPSWNFPGSFTCAALRSHFSSEYCKVVGCGYSHSIEDFQTRKWSEVRGLCTVRPEEKSGCKQSWQLKSLLSRFMKWRLQPLFLPSRSQGSHFKSFQREEKRTEWRSFSKESQNWTSLTLLFPKQRNRSSTFQLWTRGRDNIQFFLCFMLSI